MKTLIDSFVAITFLIGLGLLLFSTLLELYGIGQLTALAWDTDADGVVEASEVTRLPLPLTNRHGRSGRVLLLHVLSPALRTLGFAFR